MYLFFSKLNTIQNTLSLSCLIIYLKKPITPPPAPGFSLLQKNKQHVLTLY